MVYEDVTSQAPEFPFYFRQFQAGPHKNFHYVFGDADAGVAALIDPAFELEQIFRLVERDGLKIHDALFTHGHWDHIGGVPEIVERGVDRAFIHEAGREHSKVYEALTAGADVGLATDGDKLMVGEVTVDWLHTPGHQPEGSCFLVTGKGAGPAALFGGDTLFIDSCGRTDFTGGDTEAMFASMARLARLDDDVVVMPGHHYADRMHDTIANQRIRNPAMATTNRAAFGTLHCLTN